MKQTIDNSYLEYNLPQFLRDSITNYQENKGNKYQWDLFYCELQSDINVCEVENLITSEQAWYLREKYLELERN